MKYGELDLFRSYWSADGCHGGRPSLSRRTTRPAVPSIISVCARTAVFILAGACRSRRQLPTKDAPGLVQEGREWWSRSSQSSTEKGGGPRGEHRDAGWAPGYAGGGGCEGKVAGSMKACRSAASLTSADAARNKQRYTVSS